MSMSVPTARRIVKQWGDVLANNELVYDFSVPYSEVSMALTRLAALPEEEQFLNDNIPNIQAAMMDSAVSGMDTAKTAGVVQRMLSRAKGAIGKTMALSWQFLTTLSVGMAATTATLETLRFLCRVMIDGASMALIRNMTAPVNRLPHILVSFVFLVTYMSADSAGSRAVKKYVAQLQSAILASVVRGPEHLFGFVDRTRSTLTRCLRAAQKGVSLTQGLVPYLPYLLLVFIACLTLLR